MRYMNFARWEGMHDNFFDAIEALVGSMSYADSPWDAPKGGFYIESMYEGDHKNPPHAYIQTPSSSDAKFWGRDMELDGFYVDIQGSVIYVEPYA